MADGQLFLDPHFHLWDFSDGSFMDKSNLCNFTPDGKGYNLKQYEDAVCKGLTPKDGESPIEHRGGVVVETMSVEFPGTPAAEHNDLCLKEAHWVFEKLSDVAGLKRRYNIVASCCLEASNAAATLQKIMLQINTVKVLGGPEVVGIRQILNKDPSHPRNTAIEGDLLENPVWVENVKEIAKNGLSFDLQLNPKQYNLAYTIFKEHPRMKVIINHLGSPTAKDLSAEGKAYWEDLQKLATLPNLYMKISMLSGPAGGPEAVNGENTLLLESVKRVIGIFSPQRCMFASNLPVDSASDMFSFFGKASASYAPEERNALFYQTAKEVYRL